MIPCFLRVHAQVYLELSDYQRLAEAVLAILSSDDDSQQEGEASMLPMSPMGPRLGGMEARGRGVEQ